MLNYGRGPFPHVIRLENARQTLNTELHELPYLPACLRQYRRPVPPSQPQAQALLPNTSEASSRGSFTTNHFFFFFCFASVFWQMQAKFDKEDRCLIEGQIKLFWLLRQCDGNLGKEKGSCGAQPCPIC